MTQTLLDDQVQDNLPPSDIKSFYEELVGENKKFKDNEQLARGKYEADLYVKHLETRLDEIKGDYTKLRDEYNAGPKLQELLDQMAAQQSNTNREQTQISNVDNQRKPAIDQNEVKSLISSEFQQLKQAEREEKNFSFVQDKIKEQFGENYKTVLKERMESLGLTSEYLDENAKKYPKALLKTLGVGEQEVRDTFQPPLKSTLRNDNFSPNTEKRTWAYYQKMKKEKPDLYRSSKTQTQMFHDAQALGDAFKDGDWEAIG